MKIYRMSLGNNLKSSILILTFILALIGFNIYASKNYSYFGVETVLLSILGAIPMLAPIIFIHVEYLIRNWNARLEVDRTKKKLKYNCEGKDILVNFDKITKIVEHQVKDTALLFGFYKYYEIHLKSGEILIITNLMARNLSIPGIENEVIERYLPSIFLDRHFGSWKLDLKEKGKTFQPSESLINRFEKRYQNYTQDRLIHIINSEDYRYEAQIAAKNLLEKVEKKA